MEAFLLLLLFIVFYDFSRKMLYTSDQSICISILQIINTTIFAILTLNNEQKKEKEPRRTP